MPVEEDGRGPWSATALILPYSLPVVDAAVWEIGNPQAMRGRATHMRRTQLTLGSVLYQLIHTEGGQQIVFFDLSVRAVSPTETYIGPASIVATYRPEATAFLSTFLRSIWNYIRGHQFRMQALATALAQRPPPDSPDLVQLQEQLQEVLDMIPRPTPRKPGRPAQETNEWARAEVQKRRPREEVFQEYLARLNIGQSDRQAVAAARERFRKALSRGNRPKTKRTK